MQNLSSQILDQNATFRGVPTSTLMRNAGIAAAREIRKKFPRTKKVQIFCGSGGNAGDGFVVAAELLQQKLEVQVFLSKPVRNPDAQFFLKKLPAKVISHFSEKTKIDGDILIDALLGVGATGKLRQPFSTIVAKINQAKKSSSRTSEKTCKIVSLDTPTGNLKPDLIIAFHSSKLTSQDSSNLASRTSSRLTPQTFPKLSSQISVNLRTHSKINPQAHSKVNPRTHSREINSRTHSVEVNPRVHPKVNPRVYSGEIHSKEIVVPIGIPKIAETHFGPGDVKFHFPRRKSESRKGQNGRVVIIGGSVEFVGAPLFAGLGAQTAGVDLVNIFVPAVNFSAARKFCPNFLIQKFSDNAEFLTISAAKEILDFAKKNNATLVVGCGLGRNLETVSAVKFIAKKCQQPLVLDADALLPDLPKFASKKVVLTPHASEFKRLPKNLNATILKKGRTDEIISLDRRSRWNDRGDPILTVGGTGDVLAGLVGGLVARNVEPFEAAGIAAFLLGLTGEKLALKSESITAQMLARKIPQIIRKCY